VIFRDDFSKGAEAWTPTDAKAWRITDDKGNPASEILGGSKYEPPHRSPVNIAIREGGEVMPDGDGLAGRPGSIDGVRALYDVGTFASLREVSMHPDGRSDIVTVGTERFRVLRLVDGKPYAQAEVEIVEELPGEADVALAAAAIERFRAYRALLSDDDDDAELPDEPRVLSYLIAAAVVADLPTRQAFLAAPDDTVRPRAESDFLRKELSIVEHMPSLPAVDLAREPYGLN
jgi:Lon protease-like protein